MSSSAGSGPCCAAGYARHYQRWYHIPQGSEHSRLQAHILMVWPDQPFTDTHLPLKQSEFWQHEPFSSTDRGLIHCPVCLQNFVPAGLLAAGRDAKWRPDRGNCSL